MSNPNVPPPMPPAAPKKRGCFFYGCLTAIIAGVLLAVLGGFGTYFAMKKLAGIAVDYTEATPAQLPKVEVSPSAFDALKKRMNDFKAALDASKPAALALTGDELNVLVAGEASKSPWKDRVRFAIEGSDLKCQVSMPLDDMAKVPGFGKLKGRYLNGSAAVRATMETGTLVVTLQSLEVRGKPLPSAFLQALRKENLAKEAYNDADNAKFLNRLESLKIAEGAMTLVGKSAR
ncbi:MAG: hypothetical protein HZA91_10970 [Verrucomicrobia bacterium]|nr:hypothetical protein [Verrucomicrobiota bacterium]